MEIFEAIIPRKLAEKIVTTIELSVEEELTCPRDDESGQAFLGGGKTFQCFHEGDRLSVFEIESVKVFSDIYKVELNYDTDVFKDLFSIRDEISVDAIVEFTISHPQDTCNLKVGGNEVDVIDIYNKFFGE